VVMKTKVVEINSAKRQAGAALHRYLAALHWIQVAKATAQLARAMQTHRGASIGLLSGQPAFESQANTLKREINKLLVYLDYLEHQAAGLQFSADLQAIKQEWEILNAGGSSHALMEHFELHSHAIERLLRLMRTVLAKKLDDYVFFNKEGAEQKIYSSSLSLDFVYALFDKIPSSTETIGQVRALSTNAAVRKMCAAENRSKIAYLLKKINSEYRELKMVFSTVDESFSLRRGYHKQFRVFHKGVSSAIVETENIVVDSSLLFDISTAIIDQLWGIVDRGYQALESECFKLFIQAK